jgi:hypothetical protein
LGSLAVVLAIAGVAQGAPRQKKPPRATAGRKSSKAPHEDAPSEKNKADDAPAEAPVTLDAEPAKTDETPKPDAPPSSKPAAEPVKLEETSAKASAEVGSDTENAAGDQADESLGRREAARIAAHRIEVAVSASVGVASRHFTYSDPVGTELAPYRLPVAPMATFGAEAYPAASTELPVLRDLGLRGRVSRGFAFDSSTPQGVKLETSWTRFGGELRERLLLPGSHPFELGIFAGADASYFGMTTKKPVPALLPAARSVALRFGFDAQLLVAWRLSVLLGGAYLATTSRGEIYDRFRSPHVGGVDADYGLSVSMGSGFEARLTGRYTRYFASFKPRLGDTWVAGGALDEQQQFGLGVRYAH